MLTASLIQLLPNLTLAALLVLIAALLPAIFSIISSDSKPRTTKKQNNLNG